jgi:hypothetical protein
MKTPIANPGWMAAFSAPTCYAAGLLREYCGWHKIPPPEYVEWAYNANPDECQPSAELASWMADCHETNHDEAGHCVGEMWPGYVTFEEWKERCAKRHNAELCGSAAKPKGTQ